MPWKYSQKSHTLWHNGEVVSTVGYSGSGPGKNNPEMEKLRNIGPIPAGKWTISDKFRNTYDKKTNEVTRRNVLDLTFQGVKTPHDRNGFLIHGDNKKNNESASEGCIILPLEVRRLIQASGDYELEVVAE